MARHQSLRSKYAEFPPPLRHLIRACRIECPEGHAEAFEAFTTLALHKIPARGIFDPGTRDEPELYSAIESVAQTHLELAKARALWRKALIAAEVSADKQDDLETAALQVQSASDTAYFYAGLAFGLAFGYLHRTT